MTTQEQATAPQAQKFEVPVIYNGETRLIEVNAHQAVKALLEHAIKEFNVTNQPHLLSLFREDGTRVEETQSITEAGITSTTKLQLRPDAVKGGSRC